MTLAKGAKESGASAGQTALAEEVGGANDCHHRFLALLRNSRDLDLALLQENHGAGGVALREDRLSDLTL
jgi:hypothetical protein